MASPSRSSLLLLLLVALVGVVLLWMRLSASAPVAPPPIADPVQVAPVGPSGGAQPGPSAEPIAPPAPRETGRPAKVSPFQLDVALELVWAEPAGQDSVRSLGSGRSARLEGRLADARGNGFRAEISILAGPNTGRSVTSGEDGAFLIDELYPGMAVVEVKGALIPGSRREVLLGRDRTSLLNIGYGRLCVVTGKVADEVGEPLADALVVFDGQETRTDEEGFFRFPGVAGGGVLVEISKPGFASYREKVNLASGTTVPADRLRYVLRKECGLLLSVEHRPGGDQPVDVYLTPSRSTVQNGYPWYRLNPIRLQPGRQLRIGGLPDVPVNVRAFQPGMQTKPRLVTLTRGRDREVVLDFEPAPAVRGRVTFEGNPIPDARVKLEAPDRTRATLAYFRMPSSILSTEVLPTLPPAYQEDRTDARGEFRFSTWPNDTPHYYIEARAPEFWDGGELWAGRIVAATAEDVELALEPLDRGNGRLVLDAYRTLGLRVATQVSGRERGEPELVGPDEDIVVEGLRRGTWRVTVSWQGGVVLDLPRVAIGRDDETVVELELPPKMAR